MNTSISYNDILIVPQLSNIKHRSDVSLRTRIIGDIYLNLPIIASNMNTICEDKMCISMALSGGIGILHRFCSADEQSEMVRKVKNFTNFIIENPIVVHPNDLVVDVLNKHKKSYFPVVNDNNCVIGMLTKMEYELVNNKSIKVKDIMLTENINTHLYSSDFSRENAEKFIKGYLLLVDENNKLKGLITRKDLILYPRRLLVCP